MKDDKKKLAIVGVLGFIVVGVGAFQFLSGGGGAPVKKAKAVKASQSADGSAVGQIKNPAYANALPERDPFKEPADSGDAPTVKLPTAPPKRMPPSHLTGRLNNEVLPTAGGLAPLQVAPEEPKFGYRLSGLISGHRPAAVFTDSTGSQRLVPLHGSLDGDTQLVAVERDRVVVSYRGKHLKLSLGGTPDAN